MRWSRYYLTTAREAPGDVKPAGRQLMVRAGLIKKAPAGSWSYLPFGWRVLSKLAALVRHELDAAGAHELQLAREVSIADLVRYDLRSYRQLPVSLFQVRDLRADAWSFHPDAASLDATRQEMSALFGRILTVCGLAPAAVETFGGTLLLIPAETGETSALRCPGCGYSATADKAESRTTAEEDGSAPRPLREVETPGMRTVDDVARFLGVPSRQVVKTLLYETGEGLVAALVRGDREINEAKLAHHLGVSRLSLAGEEAVRAATRAPVGFAGPVGLEGVRLVADQTVLRLDGFVCGANREDAHLVDVCWGRDIGVPESADLLRVAAGDPCPRCDGSLAALRGIAAGQLVQSVLAGAAFTDGAGASHPLLTGSYSLALDSIVAAAIEQSHDPDGILWPRPLAPFEVLLTALSPDDAAVKAAADQLYSGLLEQGVDVLYDDRDERPGVKFKDADLLGIPVRLVAGAKSLAAGNVEVSMRRDREKRSIAAGEAVAQALAMLEDI